MALLLYELRSTSALLLWSFPRVKGRGTKVYVAVDGPAGVYSLGHVSQMCILPPPNQFYDGDRVVCIK